MASVTPSSKNPFANIRPSLNYLSLRVENRVAKLERILRIIATEASHPFRDFYAIRINKGLTVVQSIASQANRLPNNLKKHLLETRIEQVRQSYKKAKLDHAKFSATCGTDKSLKKPRFSISYKDVLACINWKQGRLEECRRLMELYPNKAAPFHSWFKERSNKYMKSLEMLIFKATQVLDHINIEKIDELGFNVVHNLFKLFPQLVIQYYRESAPLTLVYQHAIQIPNAPQINFSLELYLEHKGVKRQMTLAQRVHFHLYLILCQENRQAIPEKDPQFTQSALHDGENQYCTRDQRYRAMERMCIELALEIMREAHEYLSKQSEIHRKKGQKGIKTSTFFLDQFDISLNGVRLGTYYNRNADTCVKKDLLDSLFVTVFKTWGYI